jgi:hypothetical protein
MDSLVELYLDSNQLSSLPDSIGGLDALEILSLNNNPFTQLPGSISGLSSLVRLIINNNQLTSLPDEICQMTWLERLYANNNQIESLPDCIGNLTSLKSLQLANNKLSSLPASIVNLTNLTSNTGADLSGNRICPIADPAIKAWADKRDKNWAESQDSCVIGVRHLLGRGSGAAVPTMHFSNGMIHMKIPKGGVIRLEVLNLTGRSIRLVNGTCASGENVKVDCSDLKPGMYLFNLTAGSQTYNGKMVLFSK